MAVVAPLIVLIVLLALISKKTPIEGQRELRSQKWHSAKSSAISRKPTDNIFANVKKFIFFIGHKGSGQDIIGVLLDGHPRIAIARQFHLFSRFNELSKPPKKLWKNNLFKHLYNKSVEDADAVSMDSDQVSTLEVKDLWQHKFDKYIEVIGDVSGADTTAQYIRSK